jgi:hypothetical protein
MKPVKKKIPTVLARGDNDSCGAALSATGGCDPLFYKSCSLINHAQT